MKKNACFSRKDLEEELSKILNDLDTIYTYNGVLLKTALGTNIAHARYAVSSAINFVDQYDETLEKM